MIKASDLSPVLLTIEDNALLRSTPASYLNSSDYTVTIRLPWE